MKTRTLESIVRDSPDVRIWVPVSLLCESTRTSHVSGTVGPYGVTVVVGGRGTETHVSFDVRSVDLLRWLVGLRPEDEIVYSSDCSRSDIPVDSAVIDAPRHQVMHGFESSSGGLEFIL